MTIATILAKMQVLDNELMIASGGADETRAISALDMAQDAFEAVIAGVAELLGTVSTTTTTADTEATAWPTGLLRIDSLWLMDTTTTPNLPKWQIDEIQDVGGHRTQIFLGTDTRNGGPEQYWTNRANIYWSPLPDATHTVRIYGLVAKTDLTTRTQTFGYPDEASEPMAAYATRLMKIGINDPSDDLRALAVEMYNPVIKMLQQPTRQRPQSRYYSRVHTT